MSIGQTDCPIQRDKENSDRILDFDIVLKQVHRANTSTESLASIIPATSKIVVLQIKYTFTNKN